MPENIHTDIEIGVKDQGLQQLAQRLGQLQAQMGGALPQTINNAMRNVESVMKQSGSHIGSIFKSLYEGVAAKGKTEMGKLVSSHVSDTKKLASEEKTIQSQITANEEAELKKRVAAHKAAVDKEVADEKAGEAKKKSGHSEGGKKEGHGGGLGLIGGLGLGAGIEAVKMLRE